MRSLCTSYFTLPIFLNLYSWRKAVLTQGYLPLSCDLFENVYAIRSRVSTSHFCINFFPGLKHSFEFFLSFTKNFNLISCFIFVLPTFAKQPTPLTAYNCDTKATICWQVLPTLLLFWLPGIIDKFILFSSSGNDSVYSSWYKFLPSMQKTSISVNVSSSYTAVFYED